MNFTASIVGNSKADQGSPLNTKVPHSPQLMSLPPASFKSFASSEDHSRSPTFPVPILIPLCDSRLGQKTIDKFRSFVRIYIYRLALGPPSYEAYILMTAVSEMSISVFNTGIDSIK